MKVKLLASILLVVLCGCVSSKQPPSTEDLQNLANFGVMSIFGDRGSVRIIVRSTLTPG
jgi:hypothetical protein